LKDQKGEIITGWHVRNGLQSLIDSRHPCKVKIPHTPFCWDAWVAKIHPSENSECLFIDGVAGFDQALPPSQERKITLEYSDAQVFFCRFHTWVMKTSPQGIWVECPEVIYRMQRRAFHRVNAQAGTEIVLPRGNGKKISAPVRDYSQGGTAFTAEEDLGLKPDDPLQELSLRIPEEKDWLTVEIPLAVVRRVEASGQKGMNLYALEFIGLEESVKKRLGQHISETQRLLLRKFKQGPLPMAYGKNLKA
jgi:c-di-GMP-binding flagellar brake protein YcgR